MKKEVLSKRNPLSHKLLAYSAAAGATMVFGQTAEAQINYTDIDPDVALAIADDVTRDTVAVDINNDGVFDLTILHANDWYATFKSVRAIALNNGGLVTAPHAYACDTWAGTYNIAIAFPPENAIGPDEAFTPPEEAGASIQLGWGSTGGCVSGPWKGAKDKFLGVRFSLDEGATFHYGWVRLDVAEDFTSAIVKDYAYEETADKEIAAGAMPDISSIKDLLGKENVRIFASSQNVIINSISDLNAKVEIFNAIGQRVGETLVGKGRTEIPVNNTGVYIVQLSAENEMVTLKVVVK